MTPSKREPPGGNGRLSEVSALAAGIGTFKNRPLAPGNQASHPHRAGFARAMVFEEFGYQHARAIDYVGFIDRKPNLAPVWWRAAP